MRRQIISLATALIVMQRCETWQNRNEFKYCKQSCAKLISNVATPMGFRVHLHHDLEKMAPLSNAACSFENHQGKRKNEYFARRSKQCHVVPMQRNI